MTTPAHQALERIAAAGGVLLARADLDEVRDALDVAVETHQAAERTWWLLAEANAMNCPEVA